MCRPKVDDPLWALSVYLAISFEPMWAASGLKMQYQTLNDTYTVFKSRRNCERLCGTDRPCHPPGHVHAFERCGDHLPPHIAIHLHWPGEDACILPPAQERPGKGGVNPRRGANVQLLPQDLYLLAGCVFAAFDHATRHDHGFRVCGGCLAHTNRRNGIRCSSPPAPVNPAQPQLRGHPHRRCTAALRQ